MTDNIGKEGVESIRLGGMSMDELPIREAALTKQQLPAVRETIKRNKLGNIIAKYPKQTVDWVEGAIRECEATIKNIRALMERQQTMIDEYNVHIGLCDYRDKEIALLDGEKDKEAIKELRLKFPPYNVDAMKQQIVQCKEAIQRSNDVIDKEHASIAELKELLVKCKMRDEELKPFGIKGQ
jgi:hypothetical protein